MFWNLLGLTELSDLQWTITRERETHSCISRSTAENVRMERESLWWPATEIGQNGKEEADFSTEDGPKGSSLKPGYESCGCSFFFHLHRPVVSSLDSICTPSSLLEVLCGSLNYCLLWHQNFCNFFYLCHWWHEDVTITTALPAEGLLPHSILWQNLEISSHLYVQKPTCMSLSPAYTRLF